MEPTMALHRPGGKKLGTLSHLVLAAHCTATLGSTEQTPEAGQRTAWGIFDLLHLGWCLPVPALCLASQDYLPIPSKAAILK